MTTSRPKRAHRTLPLLALGATIILLAAPTVAEARYKPLSLEEMVAKADRIVLGEITALADTTFTFRVDRSLHGPALDPGATLTVIRFRDWPCAQRWTPYAVGQRLLICLRKIVEPETAEVSWKAMSGGNEGEMPWDGKCVHVHGPTRLRGDRETTEVCGANLRPVGVPLVKIEELVRARKKAEEKEEAEGAAPPTDEDTKGGSRPSGS